MVSWATAFFVVTLMAAVCGRFGLVAGAAGFAQISFVVALILTLASLLAGRRPAG